MRHTFYFMKSHFLAFATALLLLPSLPTIAAAKPNVIFIMCDDLGYGDIYNLFQHTRDDGAGGGIAGDGLINGSEKPFLYTPNLDRMIAEGAKLTRHYTSAPVCAPARGSLLQGRDQGHANVRDNSFDKTIADNHTLGTVMQQAGYFTAIIGKWGVGGSTPTAEGRPNNRGFDYFYGYIRHRHGHQHYPGNGGTVVEQTTPITSGLDHAYSTDLWTAKAKDFILDRTTNSPETPFFLYIAYNAPHAQLQVPTQTYPAGSGTSGGLTWPLNTNSGTNNTYIHPDYSALGNSASRHATMVRRLDTCVGDLLQTLRDLEIDDNTLVVFTSDNGTHSASGIGGNIANDPQNFDSYGEFEGYKRDEWEGGIRMPTFAWWPTHIGDNDAATPGVNSTRPSAFWDWMPTLSAVSGMTPPAWTSGVSLLPELTGAGNQHDKGYLYFEYYVGGSTPNYADFPVHGGAKRGQMQAIYLDDDDGSGNTIRYKGIRYDTTAHSKDFLIYDVDSDPGETSNLALAHTGLQQRMKDKVLQVRIDGDYNRPYLASEFAPPVVPAATVNGLFYKAFTGVWNWVPEVDYLTPVATGECQGLDLTQRTQDDNIALEFTGYISIPTEGEYTFSMSTDSSVTSNTSGGMLWIHEAHIIDDDFNHNGTSKSGAMRLKSGLHPIRVLYKHAAGAHDIKLQYSGPGITLQDVPSASFFRDGSPQSTAADLSFPLDEASGSSVTDTSGSTTGILTGFTDPEAAHIVGKHGNALAFDGVDDQVVFSNIILPVGSTARTVSAWIRVSSTENQERQVIFGYGENNSGERFSLRLNGQATQQLRLEVQGGYILGSTVINDGQWHHIAAVVADFNSDGSTNVNETKLYVDGELEVISKSKSKSINTSSGGGAMIGASPHGSLYNFKGDIDELRVHISAKSASYISDLYTSRVLSIPLDETSGNTVADASGAVLGNHSGFLDSETAHIPGHLGYALRFDGASAQVNLSGVSLPTGAAPRTVSAWVRVFATQGVEKQAILGYGENYNGGRFSLRLHGSTTQKLRLEVQGGFIIGSTVLNDGQWHHIASVVDDFNHDGISNVNEVKLYVDGQLENITNSGSEPIQTSSLGNVLIGASPHSASFNFTGDIDDLQVYAVAKSSSEIAEISVANQQQMAGAAVEIQTISGYENSSTSLPTSIDDADQVRQLHDYAFGQSLSGASPQITRANAAKPGIQINGENAESVDRGMRVTYTRRVNDRYNLAYAVQFSENLTDWENLSCVEISAVAHPELGRDYELVTVEAATPNHENLFIRVQVIEK